MTNKLSAVPSVPLTDTYNVRISELQRSLLVKALTDLYEVNDITEHDEEIEIMRSILVDMPNDNDGTTFDMCEEGPTIPNLAALSVEAKATLNVDDEELEDADYLRNLAERLRNIPVLHGVDGYDIDRLDALANKLDLSDVEEI